MKLDIYNIEGKKTSKSMDLGSHGSTFGGNPLAMAVGNTVMNIVSSKKFLNIKINGIQIKLHRNAMNILLLSIL